MFYHIVFISFKPATDSQSKEAVIETLKELGVKTSSYGIQYWSVLPNHDGRSKSFIGGRSIHFILTGIFRNEESFGRWKGCQEHKDAGAILAEVADWIIGDCVTDNLINH